MKIALLFTILCASTLNGMELKPGCYSGAGMDDLPYETQTIIMSSLLTYDHHDDIIYAIKATSIASKTLKKIWHDTYSKPKAFKKLLDILEDKYYKQAMKSVLEYKKVHAQAYNKLDIYYKVTWWNPNLVPKKALDIERSEPKTPSRKEREAEIIKKFKTSLATKYLQIVDGSPESKEMLHPRWFGVAKIKELIELGANVNYCDMEGMTPLLHNLMMGSSDKVIHLLLESGANPNAKDDNGKGVFEYLDIGYPQTSEWNKMLKPRVQKLLEDTMQKEL